MAGSIRRFRWLGAVWVAVLATLFSVLAPASPAAAQADETETVAVDEQLPVDEDSPVDEGLPAEEEAGILDSATESADTAVAARTVDAGEVVARNDFYSFELGQGLEAEITLNDIVKPALRGASIVGELPAGFMLVSSHFRPTIIGGPSEAGTYVFEYEVLNTAGVSDIGRVRIVVTEPTPTVETVAVDDELSAVRFEGSLEYLLKNDTISDELDYVELVSGSLPSGVVLRANGFVTIDESAVAGQFNFTYRVVSTSGSSDTAEVVVTIDPGDTVARNDYYSIEFGQEFEADLLANDVAGPSHGVIIDGELPPGLSLVSPFANPRIVGTPTEVGNFVFDYQLRKGDRTDNATARIVVTEPARIFGTISGEIEAPAGTDFTTAVVEFSTLNPNGTYTWRRNVQLSTEGTFARTFRAGDWAVRFVSPEGTTFPNGTRYLDRRVTLGFDETVDLNVALAGGKSGFGSLVGTVVDQDGDPVAGVTVDRFSANLDGSRAAWLDSKRTGTTGRVRFTAEPRCFVLVYIAPTGSTFANGSQYARRSECVESNETILADNVVIGSVPTATSLVAGTIRDRAGDPVAGVVVDWFSAGADGTRASWITKATVNANGHYKIEVQPGCGVLVYIAPNGRTFTNGTRYFERPVCVDAGQQATNLGAVIS